MRARISETAKWGDVSVGPKIIDAHVKDRMKGELDRIRRGKFATDWLRETATGRKRYQKLLRAGQKRLIEQVGARLRQSMPWLDEESSVPIVPKTALSHRELLSASD